MNLSNTHTTFPLRPGGLALTKYALQYCPFPPHATILDVGCGSGHTVAFLRAQGFTAYGVDLAACGADIHAKAQHLPCASHAVDGIIAECVLSILPHASQALKEWHRVCRPQGYLLLHDVYEKSPGPKGVQGFYCQELQNILQKSGWKLCHAEDCSWLITKYVAQALWHGSDICSDYIQKKQNMGYGLCIAQHI